MASGRGRPAAGSEASAAEEDEAAPWCWAADRGRFDINRPHGSVYYSVGDSALDAAPYALSDSSSDKASYLRQRFGVALGGPLNIPGIYQGGSKTFFFAHYNGSRGNSPYDAFSFVPTVDERGGNFSALSGVQLVNPSNGQPIPDNNFQNAGLAINPAAQGLLPFIPVPNVANAAPDQPNFHFVTSTLNDSDDFNIRLNHALGGASAGRGGRGQRGPRNNLNFGFHYHAASANLTNPFPSVGGHTSTRSFDIPIGYVRTFGKLINNARLDFNRTRISTQNLYAFNQDITGNLGITGVSTNPFDWGLPNLSFTHFGSLNDTNPQLLRNQTWTFSDSLIYRRGKHTWRWGGDFRRIQVNTETDSNARGTFTFTGVNSGYDFADFLLGLPQQTSVQFGNNNYHFRGNSWDLFVQDEWRVRGNLTLNLGVRYEYVSPFTELNDRIANLDLPVRLYFAAGPGTGGPDRAVQRQLPVTLVHPDRNNFAPRVGLAWKPLRKTVVRAGYGINYNTSAYQSIVQNMAFQPPFSTTATNTAIGHQPAHLAEWISAGPSRLHHQQLRRRSQLPPGLRADLEPRHSAADSPHADHEPRLHRNQGHASRHSGSAQPHRDRRALSRRAAVLLGRLGGRFDRQRGVGARAQAAAGRDFDRRHLHLFEVARQRFDHRKRRAAGRAGRRTDRLSGTTIVAQNAFDLAAERGLSSFDQRHSFTGGLSLGAALRPRPALAGGQQPAAGHLRRLELERRLDHRFRTALHSRAFSAIPRREPRHQRHTARRCRARPVGHGVRIRPSRSGSTRRRSSPPTGQFGDARRNSIEGPGSRLFDMAFTKVFPAEGNAHLEFRAQFIEHFQSRRNYAAIDTMVNSPTFGRVISVGAMRSLQLTARFRF